MASTPTQKVAPVPFIIDNQGEMVANASKYVRSSVLAVYHRLGGDDFMLDWARENPTDFVTKVYGKLVQPEKTVIEHTKSIEDVLDELDAIDVDSEEIE